MKRVVLITGVSGGIGNASAKAFTNAGWQVVGVGRRNTPNLSNVHHFIKADISVPNDIENIFSEITEEEGILDCLVNNAAVQICKPLLEMTTEEWDLVISTNLRSVFLSVRHAYPLLSKQKGAIVNVSSVHAIATSRNIAAYAASKGAILALTRAMAGHVAGDKEEDLIRSLCAKHIMGRVGQPDEIARSILFLADNEQSSFMTGQALVVDGGATARLSTE